MYSQEELDKIDDATYEHYMKNDDIITKMRQSAHDFCIHDALEDYLKGKSVVAVMGGHSLSK